MFRRFLLFTIILPTVTTISSSIYACAWDLQPTVLLITSYHQAQNKNTYDRLVYQKLQNIYGKEHVVPWFNSQDDNYYAIALRNFLSTYNIKKVFILNPAFQKYMPHTSKTTSYATNNLIRVLQQFQYVKFYFFNNIIADTIKRNSNIYDIRYNSDNISSAPFNYGNRIADHFVDNVKMGIKDKKYNFDVDASGKSVVRIGIINNIGINYDQTILNQFVEEINNVNDTKIRYQIIFANPHDNFVTSNIYSADSVTDVAQIAQSLYEMHGVNFIINTNYWYNNIIAYTARLISSRPTYSKTISFIGCNVISKDDYVYDNNNYLVFGFSTGLEIFDETEKKEIDPNLKIKPDTAPESSVQTYGINTIDFTN
ncbi:hypothetical protein [Spiroplasma endosymbiont of Polydrusus pterygomalis]|uniref:hypothetical protein n=1 Tax=Spiroplasma endosymbiont of Polydrusus pterygomalis TaxID=3139327 RepID=UPI003CCA89AA